MQVEKSALRQKFLNARRKISKSEIDAASEIIFGKVPALEEFEKSRKILLYASYNNEVSTYNFFELARKLSKQIYFPKCQANGEMRFFEVSSLSELSPGMYGISEPDECTCEYENSSDTLCIVPAICFDKRGFRLGYGKGYYDRFLSAFEGLAIGVVMDKFMVEYLPTLPTDIRVKKIISDKNIYERTD
ncbi:MAG: 5-formyltetrahydrofolate cyclo-ligase [Ruminococcus sp.]|nr:5-formyltetrahydrofolate cyclo-ligase [Ruminococcus sp.]